MGFMPCNMRSLLPFVGMVVAMLLQVSTMVVTKEALTRGINKYVIVVYSDALSTLLLVPFTFIAHRLNRTPITFSLLCSFLLLSVFGCTAQISGYVGLQYGSPTLGTAMLNLIPAFTFMLAIIFRLEKIDCRSKSSIAKSLGTITSIGGAFVVTFYNGPPLLAIPNSPIMEPPPQPQFFWMIGAFFFAFQGFMDSAWYIWQTFILKKFPAVLIIVCYLFFFNTVLSAIFAGILVKDASSWIIKPNMGLVAILYTGVSLVLRISLISWCLSKTGPLFVAMFKPLTIVFAAVMDAIVLGDSLSLGSLVGAIVIVMGFYTVIWGKTREERTNEESAVDSSPSSREEVPLLRDQFQEI